MSAMIEGFASEHGDVKAPHSSSLTDALQMTDAFQFPIDLCKYRKIAINPWETAQLTPSQHADLTSNIELCRDAIVFLTACGAASGYSGHTGGAFDIVPEVVLLDAFFRACPDRFVPVFFDEAGHRVATQYLMAALHGHLDPNTLRHYRKGHSKLPGHPELGHTPGIEFSSGRLGHLWPMINGVALAEPDKVVVCLGSDGSQMEGNNAEAARLAVAKGINVKLFIDDNDITIMGHPSQYLPGFDVARTLDGHGMRVSTVEAERLDSLFGSMRNAIVVSGPVAVVCKRTMSPGVPELEASSLAHDAIPMRHAVAWLSKRGHHAAVEYLKTVTKTQDPHQYIGSGKIEGAMRSAVGDATVRSIGRLPAESRARRVMVISSDLDESTTMSKVHKMFPECYVQSGVMERGNFSAAAGFGMREGCQGVMSTFAAFLEMCISELTMARLNRCNVLCHLSHSGVDDMADNTCHFGLNNMFADNGLEDGHETRLYFPCDPAQAGKVTERVFLDAGLRFIFTTRSKTPPILTEDGRPLHGDDYEFAPGRDEVVREGTVGWVVTYGDGVYRALDAVDRLRKGGLAVGLVNKTTLNVPDEGMLQRLGAAPFVLVVDVLSTKSGLGVRMGSWLMERGLRPGQFATIGTHKEGCGGLWEQAYHQGYDSESVQGKVKAMALAMLKIGCEQGRGAEASTPETLSSAGSDSDSDQGEHPSR